MSRLRLVLLDANIVLKLFELDIWTEVTSKYEIVLTQTVIDESQFFFKESTREYIDWDHWKTNSNFTIKCVPTDKTVEYCEGFSPNYYARLDPGEAESLLLFSECEDYFICSADTIIWKILGNLNEAHRGLSLEELLNQVGLTKNLQPQYSTVQKNKYINIGSKDRVVDQGSKESAW